MLSRIAVCLLVVLTSGPSLFGSDVGMKVTDKNYLDTQGFSVFLYDSTYHPVFVDQKNTAMEMILHGARIATNGDVRLMPTPEQWDLVATVKGRHADKENNRLTADLAFPTFDFSYTLEVEAEPGGVKVSINLDNPLPQKLAGRAVQPGVPALDLHGQGLLGGRNQSRHLSAHPGRSHGQGATVAR